MRQAEWQGELWGLESATVERPAGQGVGSAMLCNQAKREQKSNRPILALVWLLMRSICKRSNIGFAMMIGSPVLALGLGWEAFFPVALCSMICAATILIGKSLSAQLFVGQLTAELVEDLVSADFDRRDLVLGELTPLQAQLFLAELPRARAELKRKKERNAGDCCANVRWAWRIRYS